MGRLLLIEPEGSLVLRDLGDDGSPLLPDLPGPLRLGPSAGATTLTAAWSPAGGWVAHALGGGDLDDVHEVRLHDLATATDRTLAAQLVAFYLSPSPCGRYLAHLSPGPLGLELAVSDIASGDLRVIERGQPLYWAWDPDGSRLAVHVEDRLSIVSVDGGPPQLLATEAGSFLAPWWTPDGSVIGLVGNQLVSHAPDGPTTALVEHSWPCRFALDPDGRRLAIVAPERVDAVAGSPTERAALICVDLLTGERQVVAAVPAAGFFWSPDGRHLAALVVAGAGQVQWLIWNGETSHRLAPFRPAAAWLREVLPFFEQYTQSHAVWSSDGRRLVAPAVSATGSTGALIQSIDLLGGHERIPGARLAWWADAPGT